MGIYSSLLGVISKKNKPGKWRLIVDLSSPEGASVNYMAWIRKWVTHTHHSALHTPPLPMTVHTSVYAIASKVVALGRGTMLSKNNSYQPWRQVPTGHAVRGPRVCRQDTPLWLAVSPTDFLSSSRRFVIHDDSEWCHFRWPLRWRFCYSGLSRIGWMCQQCQNHALQL